MLSIRSSRDEDIPIITRIYKYYVLETVNTFETVPPAEEEMAQRRTDILSKNLPYIVAERSGKVIGYAYCTWFKPRAAYRYSVELSIYIEKDSCEKGFGRHLLNSLIYEAELGGIRKMIAVIADSKNERSIRLHQSAGFSHVGILRSCGWKLGRWVDTILMEKDIGEGQLTPPE